MITGCMDLGKIGDVIISTLIPMVLVNTAGLMCFTYFLIDKEVWLGGLKKITLSGIASEFKQLFKTNDDDDVTENRGKT